MRRFVLPIAAACAFAGTAFAGAAFAAPADTAPAAAPAKPLLFNDIGGIVGWQPGGDFTMFVHTDKGNWYKVSLYEPCMRLYPGQDPTFMTETDENKQRDSAVMISHHKCQVTSITPSQAPPPPK
jgi:hypothetical protein